MAKRYPLTGDELRLRDRARREVKLMIRDCGGYRPERCQKCEAKCRTQAHHLDYNFPLYVQWLCKPCHAKADIKVKRERIRRIKEAEREKKRLADRDKNCIIWCDLWVPKNSPQGQKALALKGTKTSVPPSVTTT